MKKQNKSTSTLPSSESAHRQQVAELANTRDYREKISPEERKRIKKAMHENPAGKGAPISVLK